MKQYFRMIHQRGKNFWIAVIVTIIHSIFMIACPLVTMYLIDIVAVAKNMYVLYQGIFLFLFIFILDPVIAVCKECYFAWLGEKIAFDNKRRLFRKILYSNYSDFEELKNGNVLSIITNDAKETGRFSANFFPTILNDILMIGGIVGCMIYVSPMIASIVLAIFLFTYYLNTLLSKYINKHSGILQAKLVDYYSDIEQSMNYMLTIKSYRQEKKVFEKNTLLADEIRKTGTKLNCMVSIINNGTVLAVVICQAVIYFVGIKGIIEDSFTIGRVMALIQYFQLITRPFYEFINTKVKLNVVTPMYERMDQYNRLQKEDIGCDMEVDFDGIKCMDLGFRYNKEYVFRHASFELPPQGVVLISGESGAGKSTLSKILTGIYEATEGKILFGERDIREISRAAIRKNIAYVPQESVVFNEEYIYNLNYSAREIPETEILNVCKKVKLYERIIKSENGLHTVVREKNDLSGGEKARIAIARALLAETPVILMDEPFAALDEENVVNMCEIINETAKEKLVIVISHKIPEMLQSFQTLYVENGSILQRQ